MEADQFKVKKYRRLVLSLLYKSLMGTIVNWTYPSINGKSLEITSA